MLRKYMRHLKHYNALVSVDIKPTLSRPKRLALFCIVRYELVVIEKRKSLENNEFSRL